MTPEPRHATDRALPLRERKKLRTRQALAAAALQMFSERGLDATTVEDLVDRAEVSRSTFFRVFPAKEAPAIEAEVELWTAVLAALGERPLAGPVLDALRDVLRETVGALGTEWAHRYVDTRRLVLAEPALLAYTGRYRAEVEQRLAERLADRLGLPAEDIRPQVLAELTTTGWRIAARGWVHAGGPGGVEVLAERVGEAFAAVPASLELTAPS
ncbi:TetR/AcrR family transcriptional regulator [Kitasatospora terrestris]|uniref:TetR/AcrR family transcriptional regulator n=1 Tax=Kitasatospora terrestris TaxID=258051 RepID=A0ABP9DP67_9ACTN